MSNMISEESHDQIGKYVNCLGVVWIVICTIGGLVVYNMGETKPKTIIKPGPVSTPVESGKKTGSNNVTTVEVKVLEPVKAENSKATVTIPVIKQ